MIYIIAYHIVHIVMSYQICNLPYHISYHISYIITYIMSCHIISDISLVYKSSSQVFMSKPSVTRHYKRYKQHQQQPIYCMHSRNRKHGKKTDGNFKAYFLWKLIGKRRAAVGHVTVRTGKSIASSYSTRYFTGKDKNLVRLGLAVRTSRK